MCTFPSILSHPGSGLQKSQEAGERQMFQGYTLPLYSVAHMALPLATCKTETEPRSPSLRLSCSSSW